MDYTITPKYHEKKDCYIYVVRLTDRVEKEIFTSLSNLAKSHNGYYSAFRGVNGFVFKSEEHAELFCEDMVSLLDSLQVSSISTLPNISSSEESSAPLIPPTSGMELHNALRAVIQSEGDAIITDIRLVNILDDFKAYSEMPAAKYILRAIIADGVAQKLLHIGNWNNDAINLASSFASITGFIPEMVETLFKSLAFGLSWIDDEDNILCQKMRNDDNRIPCKPFESSNKHLISHKNIENNNPPEDNSHLQFMGLPICGNVTKFKKVLLDKGFHGFGDDDYKFIGPFIGLENCWCTFTKSSLSNEIWKVEINTDPVRTDAVKNKNMMYKHYIRIRDLYTKKYGTPASSDNYEIGIDGDWETIASSNFCAMEISTFHLLSGTIEIELSSWGIKITYEDKKSHELHDHLAEQCSTDDI